MAADQPPSERLEAYGFRFQAHAFLARGQGAGDLASLGEGAFAPVWLRYAYPRFETRRPFFPHTTADDWGNLFRDLEAVDWLMANGLMYPRADVAGLWGDGRADQVFVKELDLAVPPTVYAAASPDMADFPGLPLHAAVERISDAGFALAPGGGFPARLASALPVFQADAGLPGRTLLALLGAVARDPRLVRLDEVDPS